jgi:hypothetical protein
MTYESTGEVRVPNPGEPHLEYPVWVKQMPRRVVLCHLSTCPHDERVIMRPLEEK